MGNYKDCLSESEIILAKHGYSIYFKVQKDLMRRRVNPERDKREKFPPRLYQRLFDAQGGICPWCDKPLDIPAKRNEIDHADPNEQTFNKYSNLQLLHKHCNREKSSMSIQEQSKETGKPFTELIRTPPEEEI